jgi:hypothetical protein
MSWKYCGAAYNAWKYLASAFNSWKYQGAVPTGSLSDFISQMAFWGSSFNFTDNVLTDQSGNNNHVPLVAGNCVEFTGDVTITLDPAQVGASITELNGSTGDLAGVSVNGSGHIEIDQSELTNSKVWQFKLDTGDEFYLIGGANKYVFSSSALWGSIGGTEDSDWAWSTQDSYLRNLQSGFSKEGLLFNLVPSDMTDASWNTVDFVKTDADTVTYTGGISVSGSKFWQTAPLAVGKTYKAKVTVWDSTENFEYNTVRLRYATTANIIEDDDGNPLSENGVHYITFTHSGSIHRVQWDFSNTGLDWTGRAMKFKIDYCKEIDYTILIPAYDTSYDCAGNSLTHPASLTAHNGCEVQLDFSGITGVTDRAGDPLTLPSDYSYGDSLTNPQFKRIQFNDNIKGIESDYIVFESFIISTTLIDVLSALEEANMLIKVDSSSGMLLVSQKHDSSYDVVTLFGKKGYNELYTYVNQVLMPNTLELPAEHELEDIESAHVQNYFADSIGPYNINSISWVGGTHLEPEDNAIQAGWGEITDADDSADTVTLDDVSAFPDPPGSKKRITTTKVWGGSYYENVARSYYTKTGNVLSLFPLYRNGAVVLSGVSPGDPNPPYQEYTYQTAEEVSKTFSSSPSSWTAVKTLSLQVINTILDYTEVDKDDLTGGEIITETVNYYMTQKAPTVWIDYSGVFLSERDINIYYGLQDNALTAGANARMYFAHGENQELQTVETGRDSGDRASYPSEKMIYITDVSDNAASENKAIFMSLGYGSPASDSDNPCWLNPSKIYFSTVIDRIKAVGETVTWRGGYNKFKNKATTQYVLAYYQVENGLLYFIVDFTDSLTFGSINEVWTELAGRSCEVISKDDSVTISGSPGSSFTIPNTGLDLTATGPGNIKLKIIQ